MGVLVFDILAFAVLRATVEGVHSCSELESEKSSISMIAASVAIECKHYRF